MNFLAHLHLADPTPQAWIGSVMPDLARPKHWPRDLPPATLAAAHQHRSIDAFTDTHPVVARSKARLREKHGRFAGVLVDIFYDHLLARDWASHSNASLDQFTHQVHTGFLAHWSLIPEPMVLPVERMIEQQWLVSYARLDGIETVLTRMSQRLSTRFQRDVRLAHAVDDLRSNLDDLTADFAAFFPLLITWAQRSHITDQAAMSR